MARCCNSTNSVTNQSGINCQQEDEANIKASQEDYHGTGEVITEEDTCQDPTELWKNTLRKAGKVNIGNEHFQPCTGCSQHGSSQHGNIILVQPRPNGSKMESDPEENINSDATEKPTTCQFDSLPSTSVVRQQNTLTSPVVQQRIPRNAKNMDHGGLLTILKECRAARDVMVTVGAFLACFLPLWIHGIYRAITGVSYSGEVLLWSNSFHSATTISYEILLFTQFVRRNSGEQ